MRNIRILALSGAAMLLLAGNAIAASSNAKERAETRELNLEQSQAAQPNSVATDAAANLAMNAPPAAAPTGRVQIASSDDLAPVIVTPQVRAEPVMAPMALNSFSNPPAEIATARVLDDKGTVIGAVQKVDIDGGKPSRVEIALLGTEQIVALNADKFSYDKSNNILTASLDKNQIVQMPAAPAG